VYKNTEEDFSCYDTLGSETSGGNMDIPTLVIVLLAAAFAAGYAFRGAIGKELKAIGADIKADLAEIKAKLPKL
jgi:hypothetical protein